MSKIVTYGLLLAGIALTVLPAAAQEIPCGETGDCAADPGPGTRAYKKDILFMSPVGYVRWVHFMETKVWLTLDEATKLLDEKGLPDHPG